MGVAEPAGWPNSGGGSTTAARYRPRQRNPGLSGRMQVPQQGSHRRHGRLRRRDVPILAVAHHERCHLRRIQLPHSGIDRMSRKEDWTCKFSTSGALLSMSVRM